MKLKKQLSLAIHCHLYYTDMWVMIKKYLDNIDDYPYDLYITLINKDEELISEIKKYHQNTHIYIVDNKGYDVGPFFYFLHQINLDKYDLIMKIHSKSIRNTAERENEYLPRKKWFYSLMDALLANHKIFIKNMQSFKKYSNLGIVGSQECFTDEVSLETDTMVRKIMQQLGYNEQQKIKYIAGTMFLIRSSLLKELKEKYDIENFDYTNPNIKDGTLAHALEIVLGGICIARGYEINLNNICIKNFLSSLCKFIYSKKKTQRGYTLIKIFKIPVWHKRNKQDYKKYQEHLLKMFTSKENFVEKQSQEPHVYDTKLIAFYLPQYHLFKENEKWHGLGFTEWTNVTKTIPSFVGHIQPQLPIDVGFYDLSNVEIMKRQANLAKEYGIYGFCFHYYWFSGKKLMEKPIYNYLANKDIELPFCICWANENWSKLWDGGNKEVLQKQELLDGDDKKFAEDIYPFLLDKRYIRIEGKPLIIIYRADIFKKDRFNLFIKNIKKELQKKGIKDIYVMISNAFDFQENPKDWEADGIVEFPPHQTRAKIIQKTLISSNMKTYVLDWEDAVKNQRYKYKSKYKIFKTVFPSWDNSARKAYTGAHVFYGSTPDIYRAWLEDCIKETQKNKTSAENIVFINAWNEWAEGAHLEPDQYYGYAYLEATRKALENTSLT